MGELRLVTSEYIVAVFGGDDRVLTFNGEKDGIVVTAFPGENMNAARVVMAIRSGQLTHVILLKWCSHSQAAQICNAAKLHDVKVIRWPNSMGSLHKQLISLIRGTPEATNGPPLLCRSCGSIVVPANHPGTYMHTGSSFETCQVGSKTLTMDDVIVAPLPDEIIDNPTEPSIEEVARNAGLTVMCYGEMNHHQCPGDQCGCWCHHQQTQEPPEEAPVAALAPPEEPMAKKEQAQTWGERVLDVLRLETDRTWSGKEICEMLDIKGKAQNKIYDAISRLCKKRILTTVSGIPRSAKDPRRYMLAEAPARKLPDKIETKPTEPKASSLSKQPYAIWHNGEFELYANLEEALDYVGEHHGARLYKEVKVRVRVEIDE